MEQKCTGLRSESMFSSSLTIGFGPIARRIILNSHASQTNLDPMACGPMQCKKPIFLHFYRLLCNGQHLYFNNLSSLFLSRQSGGYLYG